MKSCKLPKFWPLLGRCVFLLVLFLAIASTANEDGSGTSRGQGREPKPAIKTNLDETLSHLVQGEEPKVLPVTPKGKGTRPTAKTRVSAFEHLKDISRFEGKHLYQYSDFKGAVNSFKELSGNFQFAKDYLVNLQLRLFRGPLLPFPTKGVPITSDWLEGLNRQLTIMDAEVSELTTGFKEGEPFGEKGYRVTKGKVKITHITFEVSEGKVLVFATRYNARVVLGQAKNGEFNHFQEPFADDLVTENVLEPKTQLTEFTREELEGFDNLKERVWKNLEVPRGWKDKGVILKPDAVNQAKEIVLEEIRVETAKPIQPTIPEGAIEFNTAGEVQSIHPKEFAEAFQSATVQERQTLAEIVTEHQDKIVGTQEVEAVQVLREVVHSENVRQHEVTVETMDRVHEVEGAEGQSTHEIIESMSEHVSSTRFGRVRGSMNKFAEKIAVAKGTAHAIGIASKSIGYFFLTKTLIRGLITGDKTALAIVGGRLGYDFVTHTTVWAGGKLFSDASKLGKATKLLGKVAGPIGAVADIGLSIWSLTKSVDRLTNARNHFDRDDAIADIVADSVSIAVTSSVLVIATAFPPAAPVIIVIGLIVDFATQITVGLFHAFNAVAYINSEVPLLESESTYVFWSRALDWFGTRDKDYLEYLLQEKEANNIAVNHSLEFLKESKQILGVVFPSRTLAYKGCTLTKDYCNYYWGDLCWKWDNERIAIGHNCDWDRPCEPETNIVCTDHTSKYNSGYNDYKCECDKADEHTWGYPRPNQHVDFSQKRQVYLERAVPSDVADAEFKCKPNSATYLGQLVSQWDTSEGFLCENAIGLLQPYSRREGEQILLFDLQDGDDTILLSADDLTPNLFRVGEDGSKMFTGGGGRNQFLFDNNCTKSLKGTLEGGKGDMDMIALFDNCTRGNSIHVDFTKNQLSSSGGSVSMTIKNIEEVSGRTNETDSVVVACTTRKVILFGGKVGGHDKIELPESGCEHNVTMLVSQFTDITSETRQGNLTMLIQSPWNTSQIALNIYPRDKLQIMTILNATGPENVEVTSSTSGDIVRTKVAQLANGDDINFSFAFDPSIPLEDRSFPVYFTVSPPEAPYVVLLLSATRQLVFYHTLPADIDWHDQTRYGNPSAKNYFEIYDAWEVHGGEEADEFVLHRNTPWGENGKVHLIGGGGDDTLRLDPQLEKFIPINLNDRWVEDIENFVGIPGVVDNVQAACDTKLIATLGGSVDDPDVIQLPKNCEKAVSTQVVAQGHSKVIFADELSSEDVVTIIALPSGTSELDRLRLDVEVLAKVNHVFVDVQINHTSWDIKVNDNQNNKLIKMLGNDGEYVKVNVTGEGQSKLPHVQLTHQSNNVPGHLLIEEHSSVPKIAFVLNSTYEESRQVTGIQGMANVFHIGNGTWEVIGGSQDDIFVVNPDPTALITIKGGTGNNVLLLSDSESIQTFGVNLEHGKFGYLHKTKDMSISGIHHVIGRNNQSDIIRTGCDTKTISGNGGAKDGNEDVIYISTAHCETPPQMEIIAGSYTLVKNSDQNSTGSFSYKVNDLSTSDFDIFPSAKSKHDFNFAFDRAQVKKMWVNASQSILRIELTTDEEYLHHRFNLMKDKDSEEFLNPSFAFHEYGSNVSSTLRLSSDDSGVITGITVVQGAGPKESEVVQGLPANVNVFMVNVTDPRDGSMAGIYGSESSVINQFWLFNVINPVKVLNGGECSKAIIKSKNNCSNRMHLGKDMEGSLIEVSLDAKDGYLKHGNGAAIVEKVENIHQFYGRDNEETMDRVIVGCETTGVYYAERVIINHEISKDCVYDLIIQVDNYTKVEFGGDELTNTSAYLNSSFTYQFRYPVSFDLSGDEDIHVGSEHNYIFSFKVDDLESLYFEPDGERLYYSIDGVTYGHTMITPLLHQDQFYDLPNMVTKDGFQIQVTRHGNIIMSYGTSKTFTAEKYIQSDVVPTFQLVADKLEVTLIIQTGDQLFYFGDNKESGSRNVLQNVGNFTSYLSGGGANDTIYEIVSLDKDVYIYTGFNGDSTPHDGNQTIDLTDIIIPIRQKVGKKYVPHVTPNGDNLLITMKNYEDNYPASIIIVNGTCDISNTTFRLQLLLNSAIMDFVQDSSDKTKWKITPRPITIPEGYVFTIAAEELEDGHHIQYVKNNVIHDSSTFNATRRDDDLYLTDISKEPGKGKLIQHFTTIVITDYYSTTSNAIGSGFIPVMKVAYESIDGKPVPTFTDPKDVAGVLQEIYAIPKSIFELTLDLPGLQMQINESESSGKSANVLFDVPQYKTLVENMKRMPHNFTNTEL